MRRFVGLLVAVVLLALPSVAYAVSDPGDVVSAIEAAVGEATVTASTYQEQLDDLGITHEQAVVIRAGVAQAYVVADAAQAGAAAFRPEAQAWVADNSALLLQAGATHATSDVQYMSRIDETIANVKAIGDKIYVWLGEFVDWLGVGLPGEGITPLEYPTVTCTSAWAGDPAIRVRTVYTGAKAIIGAYILQVVNGGAGSHSHANGVGFDVLADGNARRGGVTIGYVWNQEIYVVVSEAICAGFLAEEALVAHTGGEAIPGELSSIESTGALPYNGWTAIAQQYFPAEFWGSGDGSQAVPSDSRLAGGLGEDPGMTGWMWQYAPNQWTYHTPGAPGWTPPTSGSVYDGAGGALMRAADDWDAAIDTLPDWGAFNWVKDVLRFLSAPVTGTLRGLAAMMNWAQGQVDGINVMVSSWFVPSDQQFGLAMVSWNTVVNTLTGVFPFSLQGWVQFFTDMMGTVQATGVLADPTFSIMGQSVTFPLQSICGSLSPMRPILAGLLWLGLGFQIASWLTGIVDFGPSGAGVQKS